MVFSEAFAVSTTSTPLSLHRSHSLDVHSNQDDSSETDLDIDIDTPQMLVNLDDCDFLDAITDDVIEIDNLFGGSLLSKTTSKTSSVTTEANRGTSDEVATASKANGRDHPVERKKTSKNSRRLQILELRKCVKILTNKLDTLKTVLPALDQLISRRQNHVLWKHVALRQFERRLKAEDDNTRLREMITIQTEEAKSLQRFLKRRAKIQMMEDLLGMKRRKHDSNVAAPLGSSHIFMKLIHEMDENYRLADNYFLLNTQKQQVINHDVINGVVYETIQCHKFPFSIRRVNESAWAILKDIGIGGLKRIHDYNKLVNLDIQHYEESDNTIATSSFTATPGIEDINGAQIWKVMRAYIEEDRTVLVWKMLAEPKLEGNTLPAGYQVESTLRVVMQPDGARTEGESTQLLIHFIGSRIDLGIPTSSRFRGQGHMEISIGLWEKLISRIPSEIESEVIDNRCGAISEMAQQEETLIRSV